MKVLLVDDEPDILQQGKIFLERGSDRLKCDTAQSAKDGLEKLSANDYSVIVSDYQMPEMDGLEFLETIQEEYDGDIPFIVFTGKGREEVAMEALNLGADRYLQKSGSPKSQYGILKDAIVQEAKRTRIEQKLQKRERILSEIVEGNPIPSFVLDENHEIMFWNEALENLSDIDSEKIMGTDEQWRPFYKKQRLLMADLILEEADENEIEEYYGEKYNQSILDNAYEAVDFFPQLGDKGKWLHFTACPIKDDKGKIIGAIETLQDITDRKESEKRYRSLFENSPSPIWENDFSEFKNTQMI